VIGSFDEIVPFFAAGSRASLRTTLEPRTTEEFVGLDRTFSGYVAVRDENPVPLSVSPDDFLFATPDNFYKRE
jgi:hypothetical protein